MPKTLKEYNVDINKPGTSDSKVDSYPENLGLRTKLGGTPEWIQGDETPLCPSCKHKMSFIAQIDSIEHQSKNNPNSIKATSPDREYMFGDVGMIYIFFCFECEETKSLLQSY